MMAHKRNRQSFKEKFWDTVFLIVLFIVLCFFLKAVAGAWSGQ